jgi:predicted HicB family RNase H-like nuclease
MKSDMMKYKGYKATIAYDEDDKIFVGEVFGIADSLNFHGNSIEELENAFHDCIENYLSLCKMIDKEPQKELTQSY